MSLARASILVFVVVALLTTLFMLKLSQGEAAPARPTDSTAVPHYFGPWPNWALSPLTLPDATVAITGDGTGATATATVGGNGAVTGITITNPGSGYTHADVAITGAGTAPRPTATVTTAAPSRRSTSAPPAAATRSPSVTISGGGATTDATATAYGGVDAVTLQQRRQRLHSSRRSTSTCRTTPTARRPRRTPTMDANGAITGDRRRQPGLGLRRRPQHRHPRRHALWTRSPTAAPAPRHGHHQDRLASASTPSAPATRPRRR